jgi:hypothetical protein
MTKRNNPEFGKDLIREIVEDKRKLKVCAGSLEENGQISKCGKIKIEGKVKGEYKHAWINPELIFTYVHEFSLDDYDIISHTHCPECYAKMKKAIEKFKKEREA